MGPIFSDRVCQTKLCRLLFRQRSVQPLVSLLVFLLVLSDFYFVVLTNIYMFLWVTKHFVPCLICELWCRNNLYLLLRIAPQTPLCLVHRPTCACRWSIGHSLVFSFAWKGIWSPCFSFLLFATKKSLWACCGNVQQTSALLLSLRQRCQQPL